MKRATPSIRLRRAGIVLCCCINVAVSLPAAAKDRPHHPGTNRSARVERLARQILEVARLSPLNLERAAALLGSRLGPRTRIHEYRSEWTLRPTPSIAEGTGVLAGKDGWKAIWFTPHPSLDLAFEDLAPALLDLPFELEDIWVHVHEDSFAKQLDRFQYNFAVSAGELVIRVPANLPKDRAPSHEREALHAAYEVAKGRGTTRTRIAEILLTTNTSREWKSVPTLRQLRARSESAK
jgi:hypothetical protein